MSPANILPGQSRGYIVPIGGAEDKLRDQAILARFAEICGGRRAHIAVIPTASQLDDTGNRYRHLFRDLGLRDVDVLPFPNRQECNDESMLAVLDRVDGLFLTGGNQLRLSTILGGTMVARKIRARNAEGMHVAGTSAGAAFMPEHMIAGGETGSTPRADMVQLAPGLGLTNRLIVDQHFRQRERLGRLLTALAYNPFVAGLGLDEDTAGFIAPDNTMEVVGSGGITVIDPSELAESTIDSVDRDTPVSLVGLRMHILASGGIYDIETRRAWLL